MPSSTYTWSSRVNPEAIQMIDKLHETSTKFRERERRLQSSAPRATNLIEGTLLDNAAR